MCLSLMETHISDVRFESMFLNKVGQPLLTLTFFSETVLASSGCFRVSTEQLGEAAGVSPLAILACLRACRSRRPTISGLRPKYQQFPDKVARSCRSHPRRRHSAISDHMCVAAVACRSCSFPKSKEKPDRRGWFHHLWASMPVGIQSSTRHSMSLSML